MLLQKYRTACAQARDALSELKNPKRKLNQNETRAIVRKVDEILGLGSSDYNEPELDDQPDAAAPCRPVPISVD